MPVRRLHFLLLCASSCAPAASGKTASTTTIEPQRSGVPATAEPLATATTAAPSHHAATPTAATPTAPTPTSGHSSSKCPAGMVLVARPQGRYCIDQYEASLVVKLTDGRLVPHPGNQKVDGKEAEIVAVSRAGVKPQGYISGAQAAAACDHAGKRLCEIDEWVRACRGPKYTRYPYGDERRPNLCNDRFRKLDYHPVVRLFNAQAPAGTDPKLMWHPSWMNDPRLHEMNRGLFETGAFEQCTNDYGTFDMVGNLHEWVADPDGTFLGGFFMDTFQNGEGCEYRTLAHPFDYHDYSTGFRCCAEPHATASAMGDRQAPKAEGAPL